MKPAAISRGICCDSWFRWVDKTARCGRRKDRFTPAACGGQGPHSLRKRGLGQRSPRIALQSGPCHQDDQSGSLWCAKRDPQCPAFDYRLSGQRVLYGDRRCATAGRLHGALRGHRLFCRSVRKRCFGRHESAHAQYQGERFQGIDSPWQENCMPDV